MDRCRPFFLLMNKWKRFEWTEECVLAFKELKEYISWPPIMSSPKIDEVLFAYIVVANNTGRIVKYGTILGVFNIKYMPRISVKGQVITDLVAEFAKSPLEKVVETQGMDGKSVGTITLQEPLF